LEGTLKGHLVQPLCNEQGYPPLDQVAQSSTRPDLSRSGALTLHFLSCKDFSETAAFVFFCNHQKCLHCSLRLALQQKKMTEGSGDSDSF